MFDTLQYRRLSLKKMVEILEDNFKATKYMVYLVQRHGFKNINSSMKSEASLYDYTYQYHHHHAVGSRIWRSRCML